MDSKKYKITILGCGDSAGVPRIGNDWGNCNPDNPRNRRTRPSIMVRTDTTTIVVDTGPDFCAQLTRENIQKIDAVLYTHAHSDHVAGMDDVRILAGRKDGDKKMPIYTDKYTLGQLRKRFDYLFEQTSPYYPAAVEPHLFDLDKLGEEHQVGDIVFTPFLQDHGQGNYSLGFRFGNVGYSTDMRDLDEKALGVLKGVKTWIADCADFAHGHGTLHADLPTVTRLQNIIQAEQVYLTHLKMFYDYEEMVAKLPAGFTPAHDGLVLYG